MFLPSTPPTPAPFLTSACGNPPVEGPFCRPSYILKTAFPLKLQVKNVDESLNSSNSGEGQVNEHFVRLS